MTTVDRATLEGMWYGDADGRLYPCTREWLRGNRMSAAPFQMSARSSWSKFKDACPNIKIPRIVNMAGLVAFLVLSRAADPAA